MPDEKCEGNPIDAERGAAAQAVEHEVAQEGRMSSPAQRQRGSPEGSGGASRRTYAGLGWKARERSEIEAVTAPSTTLRVVPLPRYAVEDRGDRVQAATRFGTNRSLFRASCTPDRPASPYSASSFTCQVS